MENSLNAWVPIVQGIVTIIALSIGAYVALNGLSTWKLQIRGNTEYELARRTLKAVYKVRDAVETVRSWYISSSEFNNAQVELVSGHIPESGDIPPKLSQEDLRKAVYSVRWREVREAGLLFHEEYVEVEAVWGKEAKDLLLNVQKSIIQLGNAVGQYLEDGNVNEKDRKAIREIVFNTSGDIPDKFSKDLNERIEKVEDFLKPMLEIKGKHKTQKSKKN